MDDEKLKLSTTTDGLPPRPGYENGPAPAPLKENGQHEAYFVLKPEERAKGFARPVRRSYKHVGVRPKYPLRDLTDEEKTSYADEKYIRYEAYPESERPACGRFWTKEALESGCGAVTTMGLAIAETFARDLNYYSHTMCCNCGKHLPVGEHGEFIWLDAGRETTERVGT